MPETDHNKMKTQAILMHAEKAVAADGRPTYRNPKLSLATRELGSIAPTHVRVEMQYVGICGTDVHLVSADKTTGLIKTSAPCLIPPEGRVIGHEGTGRVIGVGEHVNGLEVGDTVAFESLLACGECDVCRRGKPNQCRKAQLMGLQFDGLFAGVADVPAKLARNITAFAKGKTDHLSAACLEPAGVAYVACENLRLLPSDTVVVFGAGPIGGYCAILAKQLFGVERVITVEPLEHRRKLARKWSDEVKSVEEFLQDTYRFDVLFEASGDMPSLASAFKRIEPNGRVCALARSGQHLHIDAMDHLITNNITIVGARGHLGGVFEKLLPPVKSGRFPILDVVTREISGLQQLLDYLRQPERIVFEECKIICSLQ